MKRLQALWPLALAIAVALAAEPTRLGLGTLLGLGVFASLLVARAAVSVRFGLFAIAGGGMFGVMTAVLAELSGLTAGTLLDTAFADYWVANTLALAAVVFVVLGLASVVWGRARGRF
ncbi:MAG: hypothetical protein ACK5RK_09475 [Betaproteobacteria bacterium]